MLTREQIEFNILKWFDEENWSYTIFENPAVYFQCILNRKDHSYNIVIEKDKDRIDLIKDIELPLEFQKSYKLSKDKYKFWTDLKVNLMQMEIGTNVSPSLEELETLRLSIVIYFDAFTQDKFMGAAVKFDDAIGLCDIMWKKFVDSQVSS
jgi:hypothetical protein